MAFMIDAALDAAINYLITNGTRLTICSAEPANYAGIAAVALGNAAVTLTGPANAATGTGRAAGPIRRRPTDAGP